jgi:antitoxin Phd
MAGSNREGPQRVTRQGKDAVVVIPAEEYEKLSGHSKPENLHDFLRRSPLVGVKLDLRRNKSLSRDVGL